MFEILTENQVAYILYHLSHTVELSDEIKKKIVYNREQDTLYHGSGNAIINFNSSRQPFDAGKIFMLEDLPVLFPVDRSPGKWFSLIGENLVFHHDILKSAFYLLSGAYEAEYPKKDPLGRFPYSHSLAKRTGIIHKPVVNYYFDLIYQGIDTFCKYHGFSRPRKRYLFRDLAFFLSHDIDRIRQFTIHETLSALLQAVGYKKSHTSSGKNIQKAFQYGTGLLTRVAKKDPFWNFNWLLDLERNLGIRASYYFIEHAGTHKNSRYTFQDKKIKALIAQIEKEGNETGIHGTLDSAFSLEAFNRTLKNLEKSLGHEVSGGRQHILRYKIPRTAIIHEEAGLLYDNTLTFAEHEGFRNSYCLPFKLFDFEKDKMISVWQIPLTVMDSTLFYYRKMDFTQAGETIKNLMKETRKFNGIFSLLWHNSFFDEIEFPGIREFYTSLLESIAATESIEFLNGKMIIDRMERDIARGR